MLTSELALADCSLILPKDTPVIAARNIGNARSPRNGTPPNNEPIIMAIMRKNRIIIVCTDAVKNVIFI
jgi:hypothetical protein